jgi:hypothetical protein
VVVEHPAERERRVQVEPARLAPRRFALISGCCTSSASCSFVFASPFSTLASSARASSSGVSASRATFSMYACAASCASSSASFTAAGMAAYFWRSDSVFASSSRRR